MAKDNFVSIAYIGDPGSNRAVWAVPNQLCFNGRHWHPGSNPRLKKLVINFKHLQMRKWP